MSELSSSPALTVSPSVRIRRIRRLPVAGETQIKTRATVAATDTVATAFLPGMIHPIDVAKTLGLSPADLPAAMSVKQGDTVTKGQQLAQGRTFLGFGKKEVLSPYDGTVESVSPVTGQVMIAEARTPLCLYAYLPGKVVAVDQSGTVEIESKVSLVQGIFGVGGERFGRLKRVTSWPIAPDDFSDFVAEQSVLFSREPLSYASLISMRKHKIAAAIAGSVPGAALMQFAGKTLNPACTGEGDSDLCIVLTEGFGCIPMADNTADLLSKIQGELVSVNGATQVRAGVIRPELIGPPLAVSHNCAPQTTDHSLSFGDTVRIVRGKNFGLLGIVHDIPADPQLIGSGAKALVYDVALSPERRVLVPRANVESVQIEK